MSDWVSIAKEGEIPDNCAARIEIDGIPIAVFHIGSKYFATDDTCTHAEASLSDGDIDTERNTVECPYHGSVFDLESGSALSLPAVEPVKVHNVRVNENGDIQVKVTLFGFCEVAAESR